MTPSKEDVKKWYESKGKDRYWLAELCNTGKRAVDKWFENGRSIPAKAILIIQREMEKDGSNENDRKEEYRKTLVSKALVFSEETYARICRVAARRGLTPEQYMEQAIIDDSDSLDLSKYER